MTCLLLVQWHLQLSPNMPSSRGGYCVGASFQVAAGDSATSPNGAILAGLQQGCSSDRVLGAGGACHAGCGLLLDPPASALLHGDCLVMVVSDRYRAQMGY